MKYLTPVFIAAALLGATFTASTVSAEDVPVARIAFVDIQRIMRDSAAAAHVRSQVDIYRTNSQAELDTQEKALRDAEEELKRQRSILAPEAFEERRKEFAEKVGEIQRSVQTKNRNLETAISKATGEIRQALLPILAALRKETGATILLDRSTIVDSDRGLEFTAQALVRLNDELPKITVDLPRDSG